MGLRELFKAIVPRADFNGCPRSQHQWSADDVQTDEQRAADMADVKRLNAEEAGDPHHRGERWHQGEPSYKPENNVAMERGDRFDWLGLLRAGG